jgi:hypothetical protein
MFLIALALPFFLLNIYLTTVSTTVVTTACLYLFIFSCIQLQLKSLCFSSFYLLIGQCSVIIVLECSAATLYISKKMYNNIYIHLEIILNK